MSMKTRENLQVQKIKQEIATVSAQCYSAAYSRKQYQEAVTVSWSLNFNIYLRIEDEGFGPHEARGWNWDSCMKLVS